MSWLLTQLKNGIFCGADFFFQYNNNNNNRCVGSGRSQDCRQQIIILLFTCARGLWKTFVYVIVAFHTFDGMLMYGRVWVWGARFWPLEAFRPKRLLWAIYETQIRIHDDCDIWAPARERACVSMLFHHPIVVATTLTPLAFSVCFRVSCLRSTFSRLNWSHYNSIKLTHCFRLN